MELVAVVQVSLESEWFRLDLPKKQKWQRELFLTITAHQEVGCRWFDADPWTGTGDEFFVCEFSSLQAYWSFGNELREHPVFRKPYARIGRVSLGYERALTIGLAET